jgi:hypothetical protein
VKKKIFFFSTEQKRGEEEEWIGAVALLNTQMGWDRV